MVVNKKPTGRALSMPTGLGLGAALSILLTIALAAITAQLVLSETFDENMVGYVSMAILLLSSAAGAAIAALRIKRRWMIVCLATGGIYYLSLLGCTALFFGGQYQGMGVTALLVLAGSGAVGLIGLRGEKVASKRHKKYRHR